jgi:hypothetical protein
MASDPSHPLSTSTAAPAVSAAPATMGQSQWPAPAAATPGVGSGGGAAGWRGQDAQGYPAAGPPVTVSQLHVDTLEVSPARDVLASGRAEAASEN